MAWPLTVLISAGMIALGTLTLLVSRQRAQRPLACATICAGIALLFAALARDRGDATGLLVAWLILGVWAVLAAWSWQAESLDMDDDSRTDQDPKTS